MEKFRDFMIATVSTPRLSRKLQGLLTYEGIAYKISNLPVREAIDKLDWISRRIRDAEDRRITSVLVDSFWTELVSRLTDLEDVINTIIVRAELQKQNILCMGISFPIHFFSWIQSALSSELGRLITLSKALRQPAPLEPIGDTSSHPPPRYVDYPAPGALVHILHDKCDELLKQLLKQKQGELDTVIAVTGAAGSGKTVLAKRVFDMKIAKRHFNFHAWVNVSGEFEARDFLVYILKQLSQPRLEENLQDNELELRLKQFSKENRCLIVIDDVQTTYDLRKLLVVLKCIVGQSRLILITCNQDVARFANGQRNPIWLRSLTDEESWSLFFKAARIEEDSFNTLESINFVKDILRKCDGSPWAIHILGGLLSTRDPSKWHILIEQWSTMDLRELPTVMPAVQGLSTEDKQELSRVIHPAAQENIFALGYQDLSSRVRYCFLYFGLFPRGSEIPIRKLFEHWLVEGLTIPLPDEQMSPEDVAKEYVKQLVSRNLIEVVERKFDSSPSKCRMPGCIWDVVHPEAEKLRHFHVHPNTADTSAGPIRRLVENAGIGDHLSLDPHIQSLRSFVSFNTRRGDFPNQEIGMFLHNVSKRGFGLLMLLDLEHVCRPVLDTIGKFFHLKYLSLRWTSLNSLPMWVGNLPYLEILDVKHTNITSPPISFWNAKRLQRLYLDGVDMFSVDISRMSNSGPLTKLQILLGLSNSGPRTKLQILLGLSNSGPLPKLQILSGLLICNKSCVNYCLSRFPVTCSPGSAGALTDSITQFNDLKILSLSSVDEFDEPSTVKLGAIPKHSKLFKLYLLGPLSRGLSLPKNLKILTLSASELEQDPMPMLGELPLLNVLIFLGKSYSGKKMTCHPGGFPELRILKLWVLENLEKWIVGETAMPLLEELEIRRCCRLHQIEGLQLITTLKKVILTNMPDEVVANVKEITANGFVQVNKFDI